MVRLGRSPKHPHGSGAHHLPFFQSISFGECHSISVTATDTISEMTIRCDAESLNVIGAYRVTVP